MTLHATRSGQQITIHGNTGVDAEIRNSQFSGVHITEHHQHVRHFWGQLGALLDEAEKAAREPAEPDHAGE